VSTAHGQLEKMISALQAMRGLSPSVPVVAGNVVTADGGAVGGAAERLELVVPGTWRWRWPRIPDRR
jgi:hypothetical protein